MNKIFSLAVLASIFAIASCTNDKADDPDPCAYDESQLKYTGFIKNIIDVECATDGACHGTPQEVDAGGPYSNFVEIKAKVESGAFHNRVIDLKDMPQGKSLSECDFKKLKAWVDAGAPE